MRLKAWLAGFAMGLLAVAGCGGSGPPATPQCVRTSDCAGSLVCSLGYCVKVCETSRDCPNGQRCVISDVAVEGGDAATGAGTACLAPETSSCTYTSECRSPLVCSVIDGQCRDMCVTNVDCPMNQVCTPSLHLCADPLTDPNYDPVTMDLKPTSGAVKTDGKTDGSMSTGAGGGGGAAQGSGGGGGSGATGGAGGKTCTVPQTRFGDIAQGDANPAFTSGVGTRNANQLLIFTAYVTPTPDGGDAGASGNFIYVQTFDLATSDSTGPAAPLFQAADGPLFAVYDVSVAPTGEIVVLHGRGMAADTFPTQLYATFLKTGAAGAADAGVSGVQVVRTVQIESVHYGEPHAVWSAARQAFGLSWKYNTSQWYSKVRWLLPDGRAASGDTNVVPTLTGTSNDNNWDDSQVGTSGNLSGVAYDLYYVNAHMPYLTILDSDGNQVGDFILLSPLGVTHWVSVGGTTDGFVNFFISGGTVESVFVPTSGTDGIFADAGAPVDGGDAGAKKPFSTFSFSSTAYSAHMASDDTGGVGGVGAMLLETNGASFLYVTADGSRHITTGTVISSASGAVATLSNYHGSFALSLYDSTTHQTQVAASDCP